MSVVILRVALVPRSRYIGWVRSIAGRNGRWLLPADHRCGASAWFLASLGWARSRSAHRLSSGCSSGIFIFMGFIWSVIGE